MKLAALALFGIAQIGLAGSAQADKPQYKARPSDEHLAAAAGEAFAKARAADDKGELDEAIRLYQKALKITPHADVHYNLADVQRRKKHISAAIESYKRYLDMAPAAKDRREVERLIAQLEAMPGTLIIDVEESDALVFVDGEPLQRVKDPRNPFVIDVPAGDHVIDVITAISHDNETCRVSHGSKRTCRMRPRPRDDGNIVISGPPSMYRTSMGRSGAPTIRLKGRFSLDPGRHDIYVTSSRERQCKPLAVDVASGSGVVTFVWAEVPKKWPTGRSPSGPNCTDIKFKQRVLRF